MGQSHLQGNREATLAIWIAFSLLQQQSCVMLRGHPGFILGVAWLSWWQTSPMNSLFVTCLWSKASATTWLTSPVLSLEPHRPCLSWLVASPLLFHQVWPLVRFPGTERRSYCPELTQQGQWLNWTEYPDVVDSGACSVDVNRLCEASSTVSFHVPCKNKALSLLCTMLEGVFPL